MIEKIILHNYMSHARTELELAEGLTVITGPNNCGKSAIVSALHALAYNERADYMVRHGEKECSVTVVVSGGHTVTWRRKKDVVSYVIDGQEFYRLLGSTPKELDPILRLPRVEGGNDESFDVHFGMQKSPLFLLGQSGGKAAVFFSAASDAQLLMEMQRLHKNRWAEQKREAERLRAENDALARQIETLAPAESLHGELAAAQNAYGGLLACGQLERQLQAHIRLAEKSAVLGGLSRPPEFRDSQPLARLIGHWEETRAETAVQSRRETELARLRTVPEFADADGLAALCQALSAAACEHARQAARVHASAPLAAPPGLADPSGLERLIEEMDRASRQCAAAGADAGTLAKLLPVPALASVQNLERTIRQLAAQQPAVRADAQCERVLKRLLTPPEFRDPSALETLVLERTAALAQAELLRAELAECETRLAEVRRRFAEFAAAHPACPACGAPLTEALLNAESWTGDRRHA